jgi:hypothetical protein
MPIHLSFDPLFTQGQLYMPFLMEKKKTLEQYRPQSPFQKVVNYVNAEKGNKRKEGKNTQHRYYPNGR